MTVSTYLFRDDVGSGPLKSMFNVSKRYVALSASLPGEHRTEVSCVPQVVYTFLMSSANDGKFFAQTK